MDNLKIAVELIKLAKELTAEKPSSDVKRHKKSIKQFMGYIDIQVDVGDFEKAAKFAEGTIPHLKLLAKSLRAMKK